MDDGENSRPRLRIDVHLSSSSRSSSDCLSFAGIAVDFPTAIFIMKIMKMRMVV